MGIKPKKKIVTKKTFILLHSIIDLLRLKLLLVQKQKQIKNSEKTIYIEINF